MFERSDADVDQTEVLRVVLVVRIVTHEHLTDMPLPGLILVLGVLLSWVAHLLLDL